MKKKYQKNKKKKSKNPKKNNDSPKIEKKVRGKSGTISRGAHREGQSELCLRVLLVHTYLYSELIVGFYRLEVVVSP